MSRAALLADIAGLIGKPILECETRIKASAVRNKYSVLIKGNDAPINIDNDEFRLNVRTDRDGNVKSFSIG